MHVLMVRYIAFLETLKCEEVSDLSVEDTS